MEMIEGPLVAVLVGTVITAAVARSLLCYHKQFDESHEDQLMDLRVWDHKRNACNIGEELPAAAPEARPTSIVSRWKTNLWGGGIEPVNVDRLGREMIPIPENKVGKKCSFCGMKNATLMSKIDRDYYCNDCFHH